MGERYIHRRMKLKMFFYRQRRGIEMFSVWSGWNINMAVI